MDKAKDELKKCGQPNGFATTIGYRSARRKEKAIAEAFQQSLGKVGIKLNVKPMPDDTYTSELCGKPSYLVENNVGLVRLRLGCRLEHRLRLPVADHRQPEINPEGGSSNSSVRIPEVDKLLDQLAVEPDAAKREEISTQIDKLVMEEAVIYPGIYAKAVAAAREERDQRVHQRRVRSATTTPRWA